MDWHCKTDDLKLLSSFNRHLMEFHHFKLERWEKIDEQVQMSIHPGSPSEDWIIPPDEDKTLQILEKDPDYVRLRADLLKELPDVKACAKFLGFNAHHDFDWVKFTNPLIGNAALEDALTDSKKLLAICKNASYFCKNLLSLIS